jgi:hypothetical protein
VVVVIAIVQLAFYGQVPAQLHITFVAMALGLRALLPQPEDAEAPATAVSDRELPLLPSRPSAGPA